MRKVLVFDNTAIVECFQCGVRITVSINKTIVVPRQTYCPMCGNSFIPLQWTVTNVTDGDDAPEDPPVSEQDF